MQRGLQELSGNLLNSVSGVFVDFDIDDGISEGETNLDFHNDRLMKDEHTNKVRADASRGKLAGNKKKFTFQ